MRFLIGRCRKTREKRRLKGRRKHETWVETESMEGRKEEKRLRTRAVGSGEHTHGINFHT